VNYLPRSPDLTPLDFTLWGALKTAVYTSKPRTLQDLRCETETACAAVPLAKIQNVCQSTARRCQQLLLVVDILNICDFKCEKNHNYISTYMRIMNIQSVCICFWDTMCYSLWFSYRMWQRSIHYIKDNVGYFQLPEEYLHWKLALLPSSDCHYTIRCFTIFFILF
jgi:hypothetical protein